MRSYLKLLNLGKLQDCLNSLHEGPYNLFLSASVLSKGIFVKPHRERSTAGTRSPFSHVLGYGWDCLSGLQSPETGWSRDPHYHLKCAKKPCVLTDGTEVNPSWYKVKKYTLMQCSHNMSFSYDLFMHDNIRKIYILGTLHKTVPLY